LNCYKDCGEVRIKIKKGNTIQLVGGLVLACIIVGVIVTGAYLEWPGFYKHADCHCFDDIWWDLLFPPIMTLSLPWILVFPLLLARRAVAKCLWKRICGILAVGITFGALLFQGGWIVHWSCVAINCVGCLFAHEDILICSTIILGFLLMLSIFLSGEFVCVKLFLNSDGFGRKKN
jgi:hypothetical protein